VEYVDGTYLSFVRFLYLCETWHKTPVKLCPALNSPRNVEIRRTWREQGDSLVSISIEEDCDLSWYE
jgi:hypothetical protein